MKSNTVFFRYTFYAMVEDRGNPPLNSSLASFTITVTDVNDNSPVFVPSAYVTHVSEGVVLGTSVVMLNATENDQGDNSRLSYRIISGDLGGHFEICNKTVSLFVI